LAARAALRLRNNFPRWQVTSEASYGSPAWELITHADRLKPALLVVGSHGHRALSRLVLGSVSQRVVTEARCSVRVARGRLEDKDVPVRVLIGIDGSPASEAAVREVARRLWPANSEARLLIVDDPLVPPGLARIIPGMAETVAEESEADREWIKHVLDSNSAILRDSNLRVSSAIEQGDPKHCLVDAAEQWGADAIFVGSTGFSNRFERFVLGSVSAAVVARAHCTVEIVRAVR
jgi:nucleotide-binding universal stress UspA family protein